MKDLLEGYDTLAECEGRLQAEIPRHDLLGLLPSSDHDLVKLGGLIAEARAGKRGRLPLRSYPAACMCFLVWTGVVSYQGRSFWPAVAASIGDVSPSQKGRWGRLFLEFLGDHGLASDSSGRDRRFVGAILAQGPIPQRHLPSFFQVVLEPVIGSIGEVGECSGFTGALHVHFQGLEQECRRMASEISQWQQENSLIEQDAPLWKLDWDLGDWAERVRTVLFELEEMEAKAGELEQAKLDEERLTATAAEVVQKWFRGRWTPEKGIRVTRESLPELESAVEKWRGARERNDWARDALKMAEAGVPLPAPWPLVKMTSALLAGALLGCLLAFSLPPWQAVLLAVSLSAMGAWALGVWMQKKARADTEAARRDLAASAAESDIHRARVLSLFGHLQLDPKAPPPAGFVHDVTRLVELHEALVEIRGVRSELQGRMSATLGRAVGLAEDLGYRRRTTALTAGLPLAGRLAAYESLSQTTGQAGRDLLHLARRMEIRAEKHLQKLENLRSQVQGTASPPQDSLEDLGPLVESRSLKGLDAPVRDFLLHGGDLASRVVQELRRLAMGNLEGTPSWLPERLTTALQQWVSRQT